MPRRMTAEAKAFAARWSPMLRDELRATSLEQKLAQLAALMASARALGWATTDPAETEEARARWNRLAKIYAG
jgi:hypothetical protein